MYGPTMQCYSKTYYQMFQLSARLPLSVTYVLSLNCHSLIIWAMTVCWMLDRPSFRCRHNSSISRTES